MQAVVQHLLSLSTFILLELLCKHGGGVYIVCEVDVVLVQDRQVKHGVDILQ